MERWPRRILSGTVGAWALYSGWKAELIAQAGAARHIPQLLGDGGGGLLSALLCLAGAAACWASPLWAVPLLVGGSLCSAVTAWIYQDPALFGWCAVAAGFAAAAGIEYRRAKKAPGAGRLRPHSPLARLPKPPRTR
ncbi:MAG: hypothetical protein K6T30_04165 [Alicyclobacillus sp.]|nr:hypothetical protein [Alicyclobacillus sp.]